MRRTLGAMGVLGVAASGAMADTWCFGVGAIADGSSSAWSVVVPPSAEVRTVVSVRVRLAVTHPWVGDLGARLRAPSGLEIALLDRPGIPSSGYPGPWGCGGDNIDVWLDDSATIAAESVCGFGATPTMAGVLRPTAALSAFRGSAPQGSWTLVLSDSVAGDAGSLSLGCIEIETALDCNANGVADPLDIASGTSLDANGDGVPDECGCRADLDGDGVVGGSDLAALLGSWGPCASCVADLTGDGSVLADDLAIVLSSWGAGQGGCGAQ